MEFIAAIINPPFRECKKKEKAEEFFPRAGASACR
jgi:hypothetical protein